MATSKTLTPTNVTIQIPEFTDQPDQRVNSNCIDKEADAINALNTHIANIVKSATFTATTNARGAFNIATSNVPLNAYPLGGYTANGYIVSISKSSSSTQWDGYLFAVSNSNQVITPSSITESVTIYYLENPS